MTELAPPPIAHLEFASKDPAATRKFLEKAFGWRFTVVEELGYSMHGVREGAVGASVGIRPVQGPELPRTVGFATVPDIDAAIKAVERAGGQILVAKTEIRGFGWVALFQAPGEMVGGLHQDSAP